MVGFQRLPDYLRRMRILLVDDDPHFVLAVKELLSRAGHEVEVAWDGSEALVAAGQGQPKVVILDYKMPGFNGGVTGRMLRSFSPGVHIIGVSAMSDIDTTWSDSFLRKDEVLTKLVPLVESLVAGADDPAGPLP